MYRARLPHIDNARAILVTLAINLGVVFLFNWPQGVVFSDVLWDSLICAVITVAIDMLFVYPKLRRMRAAGEMPAQVPESRLMQRLPQNPFALGAVYAVVFAALAVGCNAAILGFFGMWRLAFAPWAVYKLVYATVLSVGVVEYCIFRYVQPDWAAWVRGANTEAGKAIPRQAVRNPLPDIGVFKEMYGAVTGNIAMNIIIGSLLGGLAIGADGSVVIHPTTAEGIHITGLVFGFIVGVLVTKGVVSAMDAIITNSGPAILEGVVVDRRVAWMPKGRFALTGLVCVCVMAFSTVALPAILNLFGIPFLNFYQFTIFITIYATLLGKPLSFALTRRCMQPDYIRVTLENAKTP